MKPEVPDTRWEGCRRGVPSRSKNFDNFIFKWCNLVHFELGLIMCFRPLTLLGSAGMNLELRGGGGWPHPVTPPFPMPMHFEDVLIMKHDLCGNVPSKGSLLINFHFTFRNPVRNEAYQTFPVSKNNLREKLATQ